MKIYRILLLLFSAILASYAALFLYRYHYYPDFGNGFIIGDWLINYEDGGFKRRGLSGSFFFFVQDLTGVGLSKLIYITQLSVFISFLYLYLKLIWKRNINLFYLTLAISPVTLLSYFNDYGYLGRKEFLLFLLFIVFVSQLEKNSLNKFREYCILITLSVITLFHEIAFFYTPYFMLALYIINNERNIFRFAPYLIASGIPVVLTTFYGGNINEGNSLEIIADRGVLLAEHNIFNESIIMNSVQQISDNLLQYILYGVTFLAAFVLFSVYTKKQLGKKSNWLSGLFIAAVIYTIPLFILAVDWGRWIQVHFILLLIIITASLPKKVINTEDSENFLKVLRREWYFVPVLLVNFLWGMKHVYTGFFPGGAVAFLHSLVFG